MGRLRLFDRVKSWFGAKVEAPETTARPAAKRWTLEAGGPAERFAFSGAGAAAVASRGPHNDVDDNISVTGEGVPFARLAAASPGSALFAAGLSAEGARPSAAVGTAAWGDRGPPSSSRAQSDALTAAPLDPLDPAWMQSLEEIPRRIADAVGQGAAGLHTLKEIAYELEGHRQTTRALVQAVRRLPYLSAEQAEIARDANKLLERQLLILESMFDGVTALRASFRSVEESSRRHILALAQLETCHRNVLIEYQGMLVRAHRRLGWLAALGVLLAAAALASVAYVAWRVLVP